VGMDGRRVSRVALASGPTQRARPELVAPRTAEFTEVDAEAAPATAH
jgi:hypothetical protein